MAWKIEYSDTAKKQLARLDRQTAIRILDYMDARVTQNPRSVGKALSGHLGEFWRYRIGDYRVICDIRDGSLLVIVAGVGSRSSVYR